MARAAGEPRLLTTDEMAAAQERFRHYGPHAGERRDAGHPTR
jgi:hypothetical protein